MRESFKYDHKNHHIEIKVFVDGYELWIDGKQVSKDYGNFAIPFIGGASLRGEAGSDHVQAFIRNMGIYFKLELNINDVNVARATFK
ncbi:hypothetical protein [Bacillus cereus]|uniref:Uncharacterized protein n=1 Tax=Bacillus cereus TaxID=1396 RepID=A0A1S9UAP5_BACCE|nr:hypothetical protein [Bacillus cereus]OOR19249.1 hypothetical protein BW892_25630 [Bacillus cereus]